ncbi:MULTISPECIES: hypothetical protein [unclassified Wolbachia]|nr:MULTISPECIES: hypothetical protein [unclassified Wolbachia]
MIKQNKKSQENSKAEVEEPNKGLRKEENKLTPIKEELEDGKDKENKYGFSGLEEKVHRILENFVTKDEVNGLKKEVSDLSARLINSPATKNEVEAKLNMEFYAKDEERYCLASQQKNYSSCIIKSKNTSDCVTVHRLQLVNMLNGLEAFFDFKLQSTS